MFRVLISEYWEEPRYQFDPCWTCRGTGEVSDLQLAVFKARGGPAPVPVFKF